MSRRLFVAAAPESCRTGVAAATELGATVFALIHAPPWAFYMAHTSVDVRTEMGDWPGRTGGAPAHAAPFGLHVRRLPNTRLFPFGLAPNSCP